MKTVEFDSQFIEKEFVRAYFDFRLNQFKGRKLTWIIIAAPLLSFALTFLLSGEIDYSNLWIFLILPVFFLVILYSAKRVFSTSKRAGSLLHYYFDDEFYRATGDDFKLETKVNSFLKVVSTKKWLFLYTNREIASFIKKNDIPTEKLPILNQIFDENGVENNL